MSHKPLSIHYQLNIYEQSFVNETTLIFHAATPFLSFHVGDFINPRSAGVDDLPEDQWWKITAVVHRIAEIENSHIAHQVDVTVVAAPRPN
jgi:hypothetical protein